MQAVQTLTRRTVPERLTRIFWMFGRNLRRVALREWLTVFPAEGPLAQIEHLNAIMEDGSKNRL